MTLLRWPPGDDPDDPETLVARPFGSGLDDLAVNFTGPLDLGISTLLLCCLSASGGEPFLGGAVAGWTVPKRRQGLLAVAVATHGPRRSVVAVCPDPECGAQAELALDLWAFRREWTRDRVRAALPDGGAATLRLPTPEDVERWALTEADAEACAAALTVGPPPAAPGWAAAAEAALSAADPLADMALEAVCPACGAAIAAPFALEPFLMARLAGEAARLVDEIHVLAMAYHWSEPEILALPEDRRRRYLARIREAWAA